MMQAMDTTMTPTAFARFCGPAALADVLGITRETAALMLLGIQRNRGSTMAPSTDEIDLVLCLDMYGVGVERFDPLTGMRVESAAECAERARVEPPPPHYTTAEMHAAVQEVINASPAAEQPRMADYFRHRHDGKPRLHEWMMRMDGVWLVTVEDERWAHWVAVDDHCIDVRDAEYREAPVTSALKVTRCSS